MISLYTNDSLIVLAGAQDPVLGKRDICPGPGVWVALHGHVGTSHMQ